MKKEVLQSLTLFILSDIAEYWIKEVNSDGESFDFDSQDVYRSAYEKCITRSKLIEEYPPKIISELRLELLNEISDAAGRIVELYERHKRQFRGYDREKLMLATYRGRNPFYSKFSDKELMASLGLEMEVPSRDEYYRSTFYNQYGFLLNDYHFAIYVFCKYLLDEINANFREAKPYKTFIDNSSLAPYFPMALACKVHSRCNSKQFENQSELDFYKSINLLSINPSLRIVKSENKRAYYVLHNFGNCIEDKEVKSYWINQMLHHLDRDEQNYLSKYREVVGANASEEDKLFARDIDEIFKPHIK